MTQIRELFERDPTRGLEEVQKVNQVTEQDVEEFVQTDSAENSVGEIADIVDTYPNEEARYLYIYATFGSGKTHLLKLTGFVLDTQSEHSDLGDNLVRRFSSFSDLREAMEEGPSDSYKPVFLNLLDRDAAKEPPLPFLIYKAIGRELGYRTEPGWLLEWCWSLDQESGELWEKIQEVENNGKTFDEAVEERATLRKWLYETVPAVEESSGTSYSTEEGVRESIDEADSNTNSAGFEPEDLSERIEEAHSKLRDRGVDQELLLGLDEVALFIGDNKGRYTEYKRTVEALVNGPNPPVVGTGQYSLEQIHEEFMGEQPEQDWHVNQVRLEGADTEEIVRKRWLRKKNSREEDVKRILNDLPDLRLDTREGFIESNPDEIESYPFREYDLSLIRTTIQQLMPLGMTTGQDYVQGRALLVLVRSLFTKFEWGERDIGSLVTWDVVFDLLQEETDHVSLWAEKMMEEKIEPNESAEALRVAKTLYLLNNVTQVPSKVENISRLLLDDVNTTLDEKKAEIEGAIEDLEDSNKVLSETDEGGRDVYKLVSEKQEEALERVDKKAGRVSTHRLSAQLSKRLEEHGFEELPALGSERKHEKDIGDTRLAPVRFEGSILSSVETDTKPIYDAVRVRLLATGSDEVSDEVERWQSSNLGEEGGEHLLIAVKIPDVLEERLRRVIAMKDVLSEETESFDELEDELREEERKLEEDLREVISEASVYDTSSGPVGSYSEDFAEVLGRKVEELFGSTRRVLEKGIRESDFAKDAYEFFGGGGEWSLEQEDASMLGVDIDTAEITGGWCQEFFDEHEDSRQISGEWLLDQTEERNGKYLGTPRESLSALLITLAAAGEIAIRVDGEQISDPSQVGQRVRTRGGISELQVDFEGGDVEELREVATLVIGSGMDVSGSEGVISTLEGWIEDNSNTVKRILRGVNREFDRNLDELRSAVEPAFKGEDLSSKDLKRETVLEQAKEFDRARDLFADGDEVWDGFNSKRKTMTELYSRADVTQDMGGVGSSGVPDPGTVRDLMQRADEHRAEELGDRYEKVTGETAPVGGPDEILDELEGWLSSNEGDLKDLVERVGERFEDTNTEGIVSLTEKIDDGLDEKDVLEAPTETIADARAILDEGLWSSLEGEADRLKDEYPQSPTTDELEDLLSVTELPSAEEVRSLLKEAEDPITLDDLREELEDLLDDLREEYPDGEVTQRAIDIVEEGETVDEAEMKHLVQEAEDLLTDDMAEKIDSLEDGTIVLVDRSE